MNIDLAKINCYFKDDRFAAKNGIIIDSVTNDCVVCSFEATEDHYNSAGGIHGGAIFTLADFAFAVHCNFAMICGEDVGVTLGQSCSITYLKGTRSKHLIAKSLCISKGRSISVYRICVEDEFGVQIAEMQATGFTVARR